MALRPALGDLHITALEALSERQRITDAEFRRAFLSPQVWRAADEHVRWLAVKALGRRSPETFAEPLLEALSDPSWLVREHAILACCRALANLREAGLVSMGRATQSWRDDALPEALFFLRSPAAEVRAAVQEAIACWTERDPPSCIAAFGMRMAQGSRVEARHLVLGLVAGLIAHLQRSPEASKTLREAQEFWWTMEAIDAGFGHGDAETNVALAPLACALARLFVDRGQALPECVPTLLLRFLTDPNPRVASGVEDVLEEPVVLACLLSHPRVSSFPAPRGMRALPTPALVRILSAASRAAWSSGDFPAEVRASAAGLVFRCAGNEDFRVRRAARSLLASLGQGLVPSLISACGEELRRVEFDASLAARLASAGEPWLFRWLCDEAGAVGGQACLEVLESVLARSGGEAGAAALRARAVLCGRLFALRSFLIVLWHSPERDSDAGGSIRELLSRMRSHPASFVATAAGEGR
jgi:hypothetical protein